MTFRMILIGVALVSLCTACDSLEDLFSSSPFDTESGPLTPDEIRYFTSNMKESIGDQVAECLSAEAAVQASKLGDPETLDPDTVDLPAEQWRALDRSGKRLILTQMVVSRAAPRCTEVKGD